MPEEEKPIEIEPYINEAGFLLLRDRESKRPLAWQEGTMVNVMNRNYDELQVAKLEIIVDPRIFAQSAGTPPASVGLVKKG